MFKDRGLPYGPNSVSRYSLCSRNGQVPRNKKVQTALIVLSVRNSWGMHYRLHHPDVFFGNTYFSNINFLVLQRLEYCRHKTEDSPILHHFRKPSGRMESSDGMLIKFQSSTDITVIVGKILTNLPLFVFLLLPLWTMYGCCYSRDFQIVKL